MRPDGWELSLEKHISDNMKAPYVRGSADCLVFVADWVLQLVGVDVMAKKYDTDPDTIRGQYSTGDEAYALIQALRGDVYGIMDAHFSRRNKTLARRGDVAIYGGAFGIVGGSGRVFMRRDVGITTVPISRCDVVWGIG